ncbi:hypothetical protein BDV25DRAFT_137049 [Aspergillus avenaceus]|uniref:Uncharacterized protein n=1 Tax=Aspergillus avenaceus TaxID=36643 RepID=A0A5N6U3Z5_ASPAV|nr:hypothetical protein BDV25DRAFT_137049 [Aspergillus avenaceus]
MNSTEDMVQDPGSDVNDPTFIDSVSHSPGDIFAADKGPAAQLNGIIRVFYNSSNAQTLNPPRQGTENDHFIEVKDIVAIILKKYPKDPMKELSGRYLGQFIHVAMHANKDLNVFKIEKSLNQRKKNVKLDDYPNDAEIRKYYRSMVQGYKKTVLEFVKELLDQMADDRTSFSPLSNEVGKELREIVGKWT